MLQDKLKRTLSFIHQHPYAKKHLFFAYYNFIIWQLQILLSKKYYVKKFIGNTRFYAKKRLTGVTGNIYTGLHEFNDMAFLLHFLRKEDTFFDIGANVGSYTLLASGHQGCRSVCFEPSPTTFEILTKNITLNNLSNRVIAFNSALGSAEGFISFTEGEDTTNHVIINSNDEGSEKKVPINFLDHYSDYQPSLIKIDVEGFETEVLAGGKSLLSNHKLAAIIIELNGSGMRYGFDEEAIHSELLNYGFYPYLYHPFKRELLKLKTYSNYNTIYIRDIDFVKNRIMTAAQFKIWHTAL